MEDDLVISSNFNTKSSINNNEHQVELVNDEEDVSKVKKCDNLGGRAADVAEDEVVVEKEVGEEAKVELQQIIVCDKNVNMEDDTKADDGIIGNGNDSVVDKLEDSVTDCDGSIGNVNTDIKADDGIIGNEDDSVVPVEGGVIVVAHEKMETGMGEGNKFEDACTPCDVLVGNEAIEVPVVEKDEVEEVVMEENFVDVVEKEKEKEKEKEGDVSEYEKDEEVIGGVEGNSSFGDDKLDDEKEVGGINEEELIDSKDVDLESNVSESFADKDDDEVELKEEEVGAGDIKKETEEAIVVVPVVDKDEVEEVVMEENLVDVIEKENEVELVKSDVEVIGGVEKNDEFKYTMDENSSFGENKLDDEKEVGINEEEPIDSKDVDLESNVSESFDDKSQKDDEVEGKEEEVGAGDIKKEIEEAYSEADTMEITKADELEEATDALQTPQDEEMVAEEETNADTEVETETDVAESGKEAAGGKRKRGKNTSPANTKSTPKSRKKTVGEDVCFVCFDGGSLVLCDHRGCPKGYHPSCVNHDDAFFLGNCRWTCGWHLCSICEKKAQYFCYTCLFSLCKGCSKDAVLLCVRGKKGFCESCMKVVKLLENNEQGVKNDQVDFDDKSYWEYLFRDYYIELKSKLCLSSEEIAEAKSPWKGLDTSAGKDDKQKSLELPSDYKYDAERDAENSNEEEEATKPRRKKVKKRPKTRGGGRASISDEDGRVGTDWASNELLEFVMHMKSGDRSTLSEFDVQALLLEYIKINNLRDPRQKSRIICDSRLQSLFGKSRVGHFEMLKLLESHFFIKEDPHTDDAQGSVVDTNSEQLEVDKNADTPKGTKEKKRRSRKKGNRRGSQSNLEDYAAIDMHNISLIYLRRKLMEDLLEDSETFKDKVAGTFVRIRISGSAQKQDIYRLVQVVGTINAADPYKVGKRTTNIMVEILNLNKTEVIAIDTFSNQDFTEDECKRLRQSIKCGLINRLTVGDILDKATELQTAKVNDWLETEVVRLSHLCDRASEKGRKKELRECVEKLQLLKTPEERQRRLANEIPEIHVDPKMDPTYESEEDDIDKNRQDINTKIRGPGSRGGRGQISPGTDVVSKDPWIGGAKYASKNFELDRNMSSKNGLNKGGDNTTHSGEIQGETSWNQVRDRPNPESSKLDKFGSTVGSDTLTLGLNNHDVPNSESLSSSVSKQAPDLTKAAESTKINESEKKWHYKDPSGKNQGPFSLVQLRKWNNTGYFPAELKVWRTTEKEEDSILLNDALSGKFQKESSAAANNLPSILSANLTNIIASLEHAREQQDRHKLRADQDASGNLLSHIVSPEGQTAPSVEHPKLSNERWSQSECSSLPSPTPILGNAGLTREGDSLSTATSYFGRNGGGLPSPSAVTTPECQGPLSTPISGLRSSENLQASENEPVITGSSGVQVGVSVVSNTLHISPIVNSDAKAIQVQGNVAVVQDSFAPQIVSNQNPVTGTLGWGSAQSQKVDSNAAVPVQPQIQAYGQWGNMPATGYTHPGNFPQGNQPNMQFPALPNPSWAVGAPENNTTTAPAPRPENPNPNPNYGWGVMQGNQNKVWVGAPPINGNMSWGAAPPQCPPSANQNMGWTMPPGNLGAAVQGQLPAGANPGWNSGTGNPPVQGLPPAGNVNQSWVAPQTGNPLSNVHMPASGSGWRPSPGNLGAPVLAPVPVLGNGNQGISKPPGGQGPWRTDQNNSGSKFSNQRDQGSHGHDHGYGGNMSRGRPSSYGNGGSGGPSRNVGKRQIPCPYNRGGRCRKGASCDYLHT